MHALIIEDEPLLALAVEEALDELGYVAVDVAATVDQAIAASRRKCPDLIVADHRIIDGTGTEAVLAICSHRTIPVVFVTASASEVRERIPKALIVDKPFSFDELAAAIALAIDQPFRYSTDS